VEGGQLQSVGRGERGADQPRLAQPLPELVDRGPVGVDQLGRNVGGVIEQEHQPR
jgi:hypothetical protein